MIEGKYEVCDQVMKDRTMADIEKYVVGAKYLKMKKIVFFGECCVCNPGSGFGIQPI